MKKKIFALTLALALALSLAACGGKKSTTLKVAASPTPHAEILNQCVDILKEQGIDLVVTEYSDYVVPNTAVEDGDEVRRTWPPWPSRAPSGCRFPCWAWAAFCPCPP